MRSMHQVLLKQKRI